MKLLTRDEILQAPDLPVEEVEVPEWGGVVRVRALSGAERDALEASIVEQQGSNVRINLHNMRARLVAMSVVDENGKRIFSDEDIEALGRKNAQALDRIATVAMRLSGLRPQDLQEAVKNSG